MTTPLTYPPGFAGVLANCIYQNSYTPVHEVSITAALALLAGVFGRGYRTHTGKDLALYIILVARSGIGKDGIHDGIPKLIELAAVPGAERIVRRENFASGPALHKALLTEPGFLYLQGEFGRRLKGMADPNNSPMQDLRTVMTDAYGKEFLEGKTYSNAEKSIQGVRFPALSFLGETTPSTFLETLTPDMMEDGFMSRFLVITYEGTRPESNPDRFLYMNPECLKYWQAVLAYSVQFQMAINCPAPRTVGFKHADAREKLERFESECRNAINNSDDEFVRAMWNRAHMKALKVAGILATADNYGAPEIDLGHATWGVTTVRRDMEVFQQRQQSGDIGSDDHARQQKLLRIMRHYLANGAERSYKIPAAMSEAGIVPRKYLQQNISKSRPFVNHKLGTSAALDMALRGLVDNGYIVEAAKHTICEAYNFHGKCYRVVSLP